MRRIGPGSWDSAAEPNPAAVAASSSRDVAERASVSDPDQITPIREGRWSHCLKVDVEAALRACDDCVKDRVLAGTNLQVEIQQDCAAPQIGQSGVRSEPLEKFQAAALRRVDGRMHRLRPPFDEKWEQAIAVVFECEGLPVEDAANGTLARSRLRTDALDAFGFHVLRERFDVAGMLSPADDHGFFELAKIAGVVGRGLIRIGGDDLEIAVRAEREQRVARPGAGMDSAECGAHAGALFYELDASVEVGASDQNVIEQFGGGLGLR